MRVQCTVSALRMLSGAMPVVGQRSEECGNVFYTFAPQGLLGRKHISHLAWAANVAKKLHILKTLWLDWAFA